ncbi:MAG: pseudouridine-5'-phosphate glycosidase [Myxococcaceae bacterium]
MPMKLAPRVARALRRGEGVVALETSVVAQGLPWPKNLESALACEEAVREAGAVPAAIAVLDGEIHVGLSGAQLRRLAEPPRQERLLKLGSRDLAVAVASRRTGGTTVSATCELAAAAGIGVFATGGIGGVHRGFTEHLDVSQDLAAIARFPVAVVCAGAKSVLDLPATLEVLEALGVPVIGVGTHELPGFYTRATGLRLEHRVEGAVDAARLARTRFETLGQGGLVFALPPPEKSALSAALVERHLTAALRLASRQGVGGKDTTPFLLGQLASRTRGKSLIANLALLENNARFAGELAREFARRRR